MSNSSENEWIAYMELKAFVETQARRGELTPGVDDRFGWCPRCLTDSPYCNVGPESLQVAHFKVCEKCKVYWQIGENLFSWDGEETQEERDQNAAMLDSFEQVEPYHLPHEETVNSE